MEQNEWDRCKEIINALLGLGFGSSHKGAQRVFSEINGDFGVPTDADLRDFRGILNDLSAKGSGKRQTATGACIDALDLYAATPR